MRDAVEYEEHLAGGGVTLRHTRDLLGGGENNLLESCGEEGGVTGPACNDHIPTQFLRMYTDIKNVQKEIDIETHKLWNKLNKGNMSFAYTPATADHADLGLRVFLHQFEEKTHARQREQEFAKKVAQHVVDNPPNAREALGGGGGGNGTHCRALVFVKWKKGEMTQKKTAWFIQCLVSLWNVSRIHGSLPVKHMYLVNTAEDAADGHIEQEDETKIKKVFSYMTTTKHKHVFPEVNNESWRQNAKEQFKEDDETAWAAWVPVPQSTTASFTVNLNSNHQQWNLPKGQTMSKGEYQRDRNMQNFVNTFMSTYGRKPTNYDFVESKVHEELEQVARNKPVEFSIGEIVPVTVRDSTFFQYTGKVSGSRTATFTWKLPLQSDFMEKNTEFWNNKKCWSISNITGMGPISGYAYDKLDRGPILTLTDTRRNWYGKTYIYSKKGHRTKLQGTIQIETVRLLGFKPPAVMSLWRARSKTLDISHALKEGGVFANALAALKRDVSVFGKWMGSFFTPTSPFVDHTPKPRTEQEEQTPTHKKDPSQMNLAELLESYKGLERKLQQAQRAREEE